MMYDFFSFMGSYKSKERTTKLEAESMATTPYHYATTAMLTGAAETESSCSQCGSALAWVCPTCAWLQPYAAATSEQQQPAATEQKPARVKTKRQQPQEEKPLRGRRSKVTQQQRGMKSASIKKTHLENPLDVTSVQGSASDAQVNKLAQNEDTDVDVDDDDDDVIKSEPMSNCDSDATVEENADLWTPVKNGKAKITELLNLKCTECHKTFSSQGHLRRHDRVMHGKINSVAVTRSDTKVVQTSKSTTPKGRLAKASKSQDKGKLSRCKYCYFCQECKKSFKF
jgi:hypothetical protein